MQHQISGTTMQSLEIILSGGESVFSQTHQLAWMQGNVEMHTNMEGGVLKALQRAFSGASFFISEYHVSEGQGNIAFCPRFPGQIIMRELAAGQSLVCRKEAFLCAEHSVTLEMFFRKQIGAGLFGGEGFILQKVTGPGKVWLDLSGEIIEKDLGPGEVLKVHVGHVGVQDPTVQFDIEMFKGFKNVLFGGNGLFMARLTGPGKVILQSMPISNLAEEIARYIQPHDSGSSNASGAGILGGIIGAALKG
ncbi:MAG: TIGR00266 family protein [Candidatus Xenobia bacterium]